MKFKISPFIIFMYSIANVIFLMFLLLLILLWGYNPDGRIELTVMFCLVFIMFIVQIVERKKIYSNIIINEKGITSKCFACKDIFIDWNNCVDIGIGGHNQGYGHMVNWIYFSKEFLTEKQKYHMTKLKIDDIHIRIQYSDKVLKEVLKYVDKNQIKRLYLIK